MIVDNEMGMGAFVPIDRADRAPEPTGGPVYLCGEYDADGHRVLRFESADECIEFALSKT